MIDERQFYETIGRWSTRRFDWREANCCQFSAEVARCWGIDFKVPDCATVEEAAEWIRAQGVRSLYHYLVQLFGGPKAPLQARRGWIAYRKGEGLEGSAIGTIDRKALFVGDRGLIELPLGKIACAFDPEKWRG